ncbi:hypothetical protein C8J56DRAFT_1169770 [Mycena floridula]|nr:hypothetical protein C8J56DRAFT_1169770 [Mycena floridula]
MWIGDVHQITVSNETVFDASIYLVTVGGAVYPLSPQLEARKTRVFFDLKKVQGLNNGETFHVKVGSGQGSTNNDSTLLTYTRKSENHAIYAIAGTANAPTVAFQSLETSPPPVHVRQITVSNETVFDARIDVVPDTGDAYSLSPQVEAGNTDVVFDLTNVGLRNGETFYVRVTSSLGSIDNDELLLTYTKKSENQAIYAISGRANAPNIDCQGLEDIIHDGSPPPPQVRQITVDNETSFDASISVVRSTGNVHSLGPQIEAGNTNVVFDLTTVGLRNGETFKVRVVSGHRKHTDDTLLTYTRKSEEEAIYAIAGSANVPRVTFQGLEDIIHDGSPPPEVRQITVDNETAFDATIYVVQSTGKAYSLSPPVESGDMNVVFDLTKVQGLKNGDTFKTRVVSGQRRHTDDTLLTYTRRAKNEAIYAISGSANVPRVVFQRVAIIGSPPPSPSDTEFTDFDEA